MSERSKTPIVLPAPLPEGPAKSGDRERRTQARYPFTAAAEVYDVHSQTRVTGRCSDLGLGGCYVDTLSPLVLGTVVRVRIESDMREFEATAIVAFSQAPMGMGLSFQEIKPESEVVLRTWIAELSGEMSPKVEVSYTGQEAGLRSSNVGLVLNDLINLMVRKKLITENEGAALMRQMFR
jgi:PilZ domain-containing protein